MSTTTRPQRSQAPWVTVMVREIIVKLTDKAFILSTIVSLVMIAAMLGVSAFLATKHETTKVATVSAPAAQMARVIAEAAPKVDNRRTIETQAAPDRAAAEQLLRDRKVDVVLLEAGQSGDGWILLSKGSPDSDVTRLFSTVAEQVSLASVAQKAGTDIATVQKASHVEPISLEVESKQGSAAQALSFLFAILFFIAATTYGMQIAQSVIEEKQSRIVEILVAAIPVRQLLAGKVLGNSALALLQLALMSAVGLVGATFTPAKEILPVIASAVAWFIPMFLAGFVALACIWAAAGALGTRSEDLQQTSQPLLWLLTVVYMAGFLAKGVWRVALSYVPICSSVLMPVRLVEGTAQWWEALLALASNLLFAAVTIWFGEKVYRRAILRTGKRLTYREVLSTKA